MGAWFTSTTHSTRDRGGMSIVFCSAVVVLMTVVVSAVGAVGRDLVDRQRAQIAADASALAGAQSGPADAERVAHLNGAELVEIIVDGASVVVLVAYRDHTARARATSEP